VAGLGLAGRVVSVVSLGCDSRSYWPPVGVPFRWLVRSGRRGRHRPAHLDDL